MLKIERIKYNRTGNHRLFYISEGKDIPSSVTAHVFTPASGRINVTFSPLELEVWDLNFVFYDLGKYLFIIFEDKGKGEGELKTLIWIVTIE